MLQQGLKQLDSKMCGTLKHQEAERIKQTSGSTSSSLYGSSRKDCLPQCREAWRSFLSALSIRHPAKSRVLTTQRARKNISIHITISVASSILTCNGLATQKLRKGSPPVGGRYQFGRDRKGLFWILLLNRLTAQKNPTRQWGETFNEHDPAFFTTNSSIEDVV